MNHAEMLNKILFDNLAKSGNIEVVNEKPENAKDFNFGLCTTEEHMLDSGKEKMMGYFALSIENLILHKEAEEREGMNSGDIKGQWKNWKSKVYFEKLPEVFHNLMTNNYEVRARFSSEGRTV